MLDLEHPLRQRLFRVASEHGDGFLRHDRTGIHFGDDQVNGCAVPLDPGRKRAPVRVHALELGQ